MLAIVALGNRMEDDGSLSSIMKSRLKIVLDAYSIYKPDYIICSGGLANPLANITEALAMKQYLVMHGISESIIICEDKSLTTEQNAINSMKSIQNLFIDEIMIVSSMEHFIKYDYNILKYFVQIDHSKKYKWHIYTKEE